MTQPTDVNAGIDRNNTVPAENENAGFGGDVSTVDPAVPAPLVQSELDPNDGTPLTEVQANEQSLATSDRLRDTDPGISG